jgi:hypothetical protein
MNLAGWKWNADTINHIETRFSSNFCFQVFMEITVQFVVFSLVTPWSLVNRHQRPKDHAGILRTEACRVRNWLCYTGRLQGTWSFRSMGRGKEICTNGSNWQKKVPFQGHIMCFIIGQKRQPYRSNWTRPFSSSFPTSAGPSHNIPLAASLYNQPNSSLYAFQTWG